jgi:DNA repair photolyase
MKVTEIKCNSALSPSGIYGWKYALNPYRGCAHACNYCYVKKNIPTILAKELKSLTPALVGISSVTDPYQKAEERYKLTRYCLEQLLRYKFPVSIITKSPLIVKDIDLLTRFSELEITISISSLDKQLASVLEPTAPPVQERLDALTKLSAEGLNTYAFIGPLLPVLESDQVPEFIESIAATGVHTVMVDSLNLKPGIWSNITTALDKLPEVKEAFQNRCFKDRNYYPMIFDQIKNECKRQNINFEE